MKNNVPVLVDFGMFYFKPFFVLLSHIADEGGKNVIVKALVFAPDGRDPICLDLTGKTLQENVLIDP